MPPYTPSRTIKMRLDPDATFDEEQRHWKVGLFDQNGDPVNLGGTPANAAAVPFSPSGTIEAINVQTAIEELAAEAGQATSRESAAHTTASLAQNANEQFTIASAGKRATVLRAIADRSCRLRVYPTAALRTADAARVVGADPAEGSGCLLELVFASDLLDIPLAPTVDLFNLDDPVADAYYCRLEANHATPGTYTITLTVQEEE